MSVLVDSNVIIDILTKDRFWHDWSLEQVKRIGSADELVINQVIYAEISVGFNSAEELESSLTYVMFIKENIPWEAAVLAGKAFLRYR